VEKPVDRSADKGTALLLGSTADGVDLCSKFNLPEDCDLCEEFGWYGDGECDQELIDRGLCTGPDQDCQGACLFGEETTTDGYRNYDPLGCAGEDELDRLSLVQMEQIVQGEYERRGQALNIQDVLESSDDRDVCWGEVRDDQGWRYLIYTYYQGDTQVAFYFHDGDRVLAYVEGGDIYDCAVGDANCLFGTTGTAIRENPAFELTASRLVRVADLQEVSGIRRLQMRHGMERYYIYDTQPLSLEEAILRTDAQVIRMDDYQTANGRKFVFYSLGEDATDFGFVLAQADEVQAQAYDLRINDCIPSL
jgi:hypothetical protein